MQRALGTPLLALFLCGLLLLGAQAQDSAQAADEPGSQAQASDSEPDAMPTTKPTMKTAAVLSVDGSISGVVYGSDGKKQVTRSGAAGSALFKAVQLNAGQSLEVAFTPQLSGAAAKPQQAMLMAASKAFPGLAAYAVAKAKKDGHVHVASLSTSSIEKQLGPLSGELALSLLLGDPSAPKGLSLELGSMTLPEPANGAQPKPKLLSARFQPLNNLKPALSHTFRAPDKRAPAVVSLAFTALALAPLALLVLYLTAGLGVNLKGLPSGPAMLWVVLFHGGIAALLGLYALFWLRLNLATTLPLAAGIGIFIAGSGWKALGAISAERLAAEAKSSGAGVAKKTQ